MSRPRRRQRERVQRLMASSWHNSSVVRQGVGVMAAGAAWQWQPDRLPMATGPSCQRRLLILRTSAAPCAP
ncbi:MAG: hypothetical protein ACK583_08015 [Cyanobacteriota bacterium]